MLAPRVEPGDETEHALVLVLHRGAIAAAQLFAFQGAAEAPEEAPVKRQMTPGRYPLRLFGDRVGLDLVVEGLAHGHRTVDEQQVPGVVDISEAAERLALGELVLRRDDVLMQRERVLAGRGDPELDGTLGELDHRQPRTGGERAPRAVGAVRNVDGSYSRLGRLRLPWDRP